MCCSLVVDGCLRFGARCVLVFVVACVSVLGLFVSCGLLLVFFLLLVSCFLFCLFVGCCSVFVVLCLLFVFVCWSLLFGVCGLMFGACYPCVVRSAVPL